MEKQGIKSYIESITRIDDKFWTELQSQSKTITLNPGERYVKEGDYVKNIGFLQSGIIRIYYLDENGNEWNKAFLEKNAFLLGNINAVSYTHLTLPTIYSV